MKYRRKGLASDCRQKMEIMDKALLFKKIPSVDRVLNDLQSSEPRAMILRVIQDYLQKLRDNILHRQCAEIEEMLCYQTILDDLNEEILQKKKNNICRALNATGVILHTGLGRAVLPPTAIENIGEHLRGYSVLEVDRATGRRKNRDYSVRNLLCELTGAEDATVVNNNAAAVLLILAAMAHDKEVIVSRGQLVEIGGTFRIPDVMRQSGAILIEVGCTNKVHLSDYEQAISERTAAILYVHTSNYKVMGFTREVTVSELAALAQKMGIPFIQDAGSGALTSYSWGIGDEPLIFDSIEKGVDLVSFSGDKLLGACQAGIIVGKKDLVEKVRKHPLARALRVDKVTLSILETTLRHYLDPKKVAKHVPTVCMLTVEAKTIQERAKRIAEQLRAELEDCQVEVVSVDSRAGSGAFPVQNIPSYAVAIHSKAPSNRFAKELRLSRTPVFVRIHDDVLLLDPRTLLPENDCEVAEIVVEVYKRLSHFDKKSD